MSKPILIFEPMTEAHIEPLTAIMVRAFDDDARRYRNCEHDGPPGYDDGSFLRKWGLESGAAAFALYREGQLVGGIILFFSPDGQEGVLGCLFIDSACHGKGLGRAAWFQAEEKYPLVRTWRTETPAISYRNHCFYINTCGFRVESVSDPHDPMQAQFQMVCFCPWNMSGCCLSAVCWCC